MTEGQKRADRIIQQEMLKVGSKLRHARSYDEWECAMYELEELGKACKVVHAKTPNMEAERQHDGAGLNRGLFDAD